MAERPKIITPNDGRGDNFPGSTLVSSKACGLGPSVPQKANIVTDAANRVAKALDADVLFYNGALTRQDAKTVTDLVLARKKRQQVLLIMATSGGDPDAAYLIAKCLQCNYDRFLFFVAGYCKSGGTLVAIGADELIFSQYGELGPLDIQLPKKDELGGQESGWAISTALNALTEEAYAAFESFFLDLIRGSRGQITLQTAAKIAADLTTGLLSPIFGQINPLYVGEVARALNITKQYGLMLDQKSQNLKPEGLEKLISGFVSHGFVIDGHEARNIFQRISFSEGPVAELGTALGESVIKVIAVNKTPSIGFLSDQLKVETTGDARHENEQGSKRGSTGIAPAQEGKRLSPPKKAVGQRGTRGRGRDARDSNKPEAADRN